MLNRNSMCLKMNLIVTLAVAISVFSSCSDKVRMDVPVNDWPWTDEEEVVVPAPEIPSEPNQAYVDAGWINVEDAFGTLPEHISVYKSPAELQGKPAIAYIAVADMSKADWDVWSVKADKDYKTTDSYRTPSQVYDDTRSVIIINGGYF